MEKYKISLNGKVYEVIVEKLEMGEEAPSKVEKKSVIDAPKTVETSKAIPEGNEEIKAPIPGGVLDVVVKVGDIVKSGQTLVIIEAMKLENEIVAPRDGKITAINVAKGDKVVLGDTLVSLA